MAPDRLGGGRGRLAHARRTDRARRAPRSDAGCGGFGRDRAWGLDRSAHALARRGPGSPVGRGACATRRGRCTTLRSFGWEVAVEVSFSRNGERGSIDVLAFHPAHRALVVIEVKSVTPDMQAMLGGLDRKARLGAIDRPGPRMGLVASLHESLSSWNTRTNRRRVEAHEASLHAVLPAGTRDVLRWLAEPATPAVRGIWFVSDARGMDAMGVRRHRVRVRRP